MGARKNNLILFDGRDFIFLKQNNVISGKKKPDINDAGFLILLNCLFINYRLLLAVLQAKYAQNTTQVSPARQCFVSTNCAQTI